MFGDPVPKAAFGIPGDPILWDKRSGAYQTKFKITGSGV